MSPSLQIKNLFFAHPSRDEKTGFSLVLEDFSFYPGGFTAILGPNGSGKTTLLSLLRGRIPCQKGKILTEGREISSIPGRERAGIIGLLPQTSEPPPALRTGEILAMAFYRKTRSFRLSRGERREMDRVITRLELQSCRNAMVNSLSGGEYQRVLLGRLLLQDSRILLLDEPANHLDLKHQLTLLKILKEEAEKGKTVIAILHDMNQALGWADRVLLMDRGRAAAQGTAREVLSPRRIKEIYGIDCEYFHPREGGQPILGIKQKP